MNDKELLELAAKAAGIEEVLFRDGADDDGYGNGIWTYTWIRDEAGRLIDWNPITDDGDALRLAVKLEIDVSFEDFGYVCNQTGSYALGEDPYAATRRAIVEAAAEIGKGK